LHATKLFGWLAEIIVTESHQQFMGPLITLIHERFHCSFSLFLVQQQRMDVWDRNIGVYLPKNFKPGLDNDLCLGRKKWILPPVNSRAVSTITFA
jgi:hypothetical protein